MVANVEGMAVAHHQRWAELNPETVAAMPAEDFVSHIHGGAGPFGGRDAIHRLIVACLRLVPDRHVVMKVDHLGFGDDASGQIDGARFIVDGADVIAMDGLMARGDTCLDAASLIAQIGPLPHIGAPAQPLPVRQQPGTRSIKTIRSIKTKEHCDGD